MELDEFKVECDTSTYRYHDSRKGVIEAERAIPKEWVGDEKISRFPISNTFYWAYARDGSFKGVHKIFVISQGLEGAGSPQGLGYVETSPAFLNTHNRLEVTKGVNSVGYQCQTQRCCFNTDVVLRIRMLNEKLMRVHKTPEQFALKLPELKAIYPPRKASSGETIQIASKIYTHLKPYGVLVDHSQMLLLWQDEDGYMRGWEKIDGLPLGRKRYASCVDQNFFVEDGEKSYIDSFVERLHPNSLKQISKAALGLKTLAL